MSKRGMRRPLWQPSMNLSTCFITLCHFIGKALIKISFLDKNLTIEQHSKKGWDLRKEGGKVNKETGTLLERDFFFSLTLVLMRKDKQGVSK